MVNASGRYRVIDTEFTLRYTSDSIGDAISFYAAMLDSDAGDEMGGMLLDTRYPGWHEASKVILVGFRSHEGCERREDTRAHAVEVARQVRVNVTGRA
jgi:hypothetical protein